MRRPRQKSAMAAGDEKIGRRPGLADHLQLLQRPLALGGPARRWSSFWRTSDLQLAAAVGKQLFQAVEGEGRALGQAQGVGHGTAGHARRSGGAMAVAGQQAVQGGVRLEGFGQGQVLEDGPGHGVFARVAGPAQRLRPGQGNAARRRARSRSHWPLPHSRPR